MAVIIRTSCVSEPMIISHACREGNSHVLERGSWTIKQGRWDDGQLFCFAVMVVDACAHGSRCNALMFSTLQDSHRS